MNYLNISELIGKTLSDIKINNDDSEIVFFTTEGEEYMMHHSQDCCESVSIDDIVGDISDLIGEPILKAEEVCNSEDQFDKNLSGSFTWTFYHLATIKGYVDIKWLGESNGYYSESVDFVKIK